MICKKCGAEIDNKAVICVKCGCKVKKPLFKKWWFWCLIVFLLIVVIGSSDSTEDPVVSSIDSSSFETESATSEENIVIVSPTATTKPTNKPVATSAPRPTATTKPTSTPKPVAKNYYGVGETYSGRSEKVTIVSWETWNNYEYYTHPKEGNIVIRAYVQYENVSNSSDSFIYSGSFDCYVDNMVCSEFLWHNDTKDLVGGSVSSGRKTEGWIYFEVPASFNTLEVEYETWGYPSKRINFKLK